MTASVPAKPRYPELESLRGLAACVVVVHHCLLTSPLIYPYNPATAVEWVRGLTFTPLHLVWAGYEAVVLFFVLSGFVLTLGVWEGRSLKMEAFIVRRIWRIWVPFVPVVALAYLAGALLGNSPLPQVSTWFNSIWVEAGPRAFLEHLLMLGQMDQFGSAFIPVVWTLKYELWLSLLLPLVVLIARQKLWMAVLMSGASSLLAFHLTGDTLPRIVEFLPMFVTGALLARFHTHLRSWAAQHSSAFNGLLLALAGVLAIFSWLVYPANTEVQRSATDLSIIAGAALLVVLALGWPTLRQMLLLAPLRWLGQVSFSVYLLHTLVLTVMVRLAWFPVWVVMMLTLPLTLLLAGLYHRWVERPAMQMGRRLTSSPSALPSQPAEAGVSLTQPR
ncbi:acyltransferase family protein [Deinococcus alpinitundrae]|uniref:acyltransferase family protein n=1 Tax=Deinococcus alpinitundrae TaxID=468913 RepID=UPI00137B4786|nr:acyltransferase [Deinococcus alpinitundrae]